MGQVAERGSKDGLTSNQNPPGDVELVPDNLAISSHEVGNVKHVETWLHSLGFETVKVSLDHYSQSIIMEFPGSNRYSIEYGISSIGKFRERFVEFLAKYAESKATYFLKIVDCHDEKILFTSKDYENHYVLDRDDTTKVFWDAFKDKVGDGFLLRGACIKVLADSGETLGYRWINDTDAKYDLQYDISGPQEKSVGPTPITKATELFNPYLLKFIGVRA